LDDAEMNHAELWKRGVVEFAHVRGATTATRLRVEAEIFVAAQRTGAARLLELAGLYDGAVTTLWQTFVVPGPNQLPISHVAIVAPSGAHLQIEACARNFPHVDVRVFPTLEKARAWIVEAP